MASFDEIRKILDEILIAEKLLQVEINACEGKLGKVVEKNVDVSRELNAKARSASSHIQSNRVANTFLHKKPSAEYVLYKTRLNQLYAVREEHSKWANRILGVIGGHARELLSAVKHATKEGTRKVGFVGADVSVGTNEKYAKAIQNKFTVSNELSQVDEMIAKAANQLTGETGESPLPTQRGVIDVFIKSDGNSWPFNPGEVPNPEGGIYEQKTLEQLKKRAADRIKIQLQKYSRGKAGLNDVTIKSLHDSKKIPIKRLDPESNNSLYVPVRGRANVIKQVITAKITFGSPRITSDDKKVTKLVFTVTKKAENVLDVIFTRFN